jgi:C-terminal processing protease CtpA/Prc
VDAAVLGCTAAVGAVGGAKRERDTSPKQLSGTWRRRGLVGSTSGPINTKIRLRIARNAQDEPIALTIVRAVIRRKAQATTF